MIYRLGIDLGGTSAKIAVVNERKKIVKEGSVDTSGKPDPRELVKQVGKVSRILIRGKKIQSVGLGVAGDIDYKRGVVRLSPNLGWEKVPLRSYLRKELGRQVTVDNDANVAAWGIYQTQAPRTVKNVIVVTLGTGVGGGIVINGEVYRGTTGTAGEIGHMIVYDNGPRCNCGNYGCLEAYVGGYYLKKIVRRRLEQGEESQLRELFNQDPDQLSPYAVSEAAKRGDKFSLELWNEVGHLLGVALGNLIYLLNPQMIFLTGGVAQAKNLILKPLWDTLKQRAFKVPIGAVKIKVAEDAAHMGVIGASLL